MSTESDIVERLRDKVTSDHKRGCQGREYRCSCGYDDTKDALIELAAAEINKLRAERDAAVENVLATIDPWTRGAFTGWVGKTYRSRITLDRAEDHFTECMRDMKDDVRAKLAGAPAVIATERHRE